MAKYTIVPDGLNAYGVEVTSEARFLSKRGFATESELEVAAWITEQQAAEATSAGRDRPRDRAKDRHAQATAPSHHARTNSSASAIR